MKLLLSSERSAIVVAFVILFTVSANALPINEYRKFDEARLKAVFDGIRLVDQVAVAIDAHEGIGR